MSSGDIRAYLKTQQRMMGNAKGPNVPNPNVRWGKRLTVTYDGKNLNNGTASATMVSSDVFARNVPMAFAFRFGDPNNPLAPLRPFIQPGTFDPSGGGTNISGFRVTITRSIDPKTGPVVDTVDLDEGESMPTCELLALQITIAITVIAKFVGTPTVPWTIEVTACPVDSISCDSLTGNSGWDTVFIPPLATESTPELQGYKTLTSGAVDSFSPVLLLPENPRRSQFSIVNTGPIPVAIGFGPTIGVIPLVSPFFPSWGLVSMGSVPYATLILPGNTDPTKEFARYESPLGGFTGEVWGTAQTGQTPKQGVVNITEGVRTVL